MSTRKHRRTNSGVGDLLSRGPEGKAVDAFCDRLTIGFPDSYHYLC